MDGKSYKEIDKIRREIIEEVKRDLGEEVNFIDSFIKDAPKDANPIWYLGQSIVLMSKADVVYFAKGWRNAKGCVIENICANEYGLMTIQTN